VNILAITATASAVTVSVGLALQGVTIGDAGTFLERWGPWGLVPLFFFMVYRLARLLGKWAQPWVERILASHLALLETVKDGTESLTKSFEKLADSAEVSAHERKELLDATARIEQRINLLKPDGPPRTQ